jgi:hypothetical protein
MAKMTRQFLTGRIRIKNHERVDVLLGVSEFEHSLINSDPQLREQRAVVSMAATEGDQYLSLTAADIQDLAVALIQCLHEDGEVLAVLRKAIAVRRKPRPDGGLIKRLQQFTRQAP